MGERPEEGPSREETVGLKNNLLQPLGATRTFRHSWHVKTILRVKHDGAETPSTQSGQTSAQSSTLPPALWTPKQAAARANFKSPVTILRAFRRGDLRGYKLSGRVVRFDPLDVENWLSAARVG